jgi:hypothetical protein
MLQPRFRAWPKKANVIKGWHQGRSNKQQRKQEPKITTLKRCACEIQTKRMTGMLKGREDDIPKGSKIQTEASATQFASQGPGVLFFLFCHLQEGRKFVEQQ